MAHYDVSFAFGKTGTYMLNHQNGIVRRNIPPGLAKCLQEKRIRKILTLAMDANDNYFCRYRTADGHEGYAHSHGLENVYKSFYSFWVKHEKKTVGVTFGPRVGDDVAWAPRGGWAGWGTHNTFDWIRDRLHRSRVRSAAFGIGDAQVFAFTDGIVAWNRLGHYPDLKVLIQKQRQGDVVFVAMNPYRGNEYFVVLANAEVHIRASAVVEKDVVKVLEAYPSLEVISSTLVKHNTTVRTSVGLPKHTRRKEFLNGIARSAASAATTALVSAAFGACNVM